MKLIDLLSVMPDDQVVSLQYMDTGHSVRGDTDSIQCLMDDNLLNSSNVQKIQTEGDCIKIWVRDEE
jgi:hypothetical protein